MDLSGLSTQDLMALKSGDLTKVSTEGLTYLKNQQTPKPDVGPPPAFGPSGKAENVEMRAPPEEPTGEEHASEIGETFKNHPFTFLPGMAENAISGATGGAVRTFKRMFEPGEPITGDEGYQPHLEAGKEIQGELGEEARHIGGVYDRVAGTGPGATQFKEDFGKVSDLAGTAGLVAPVVGAMGEGESAAAGAARSAQNVPSVARRLSENGYDLLPSDLKRINPAAAARGDIAGGVGETYNPPGENFHYGNAANTNRLAAEQIQAPNPEHITPGDLDTARGIGPDGNVQTMRPNAQGVPTETPLNVYNRAAASAHGEPVTTQIGGDLDNVADSTQASNNTTRNNIQKLVDQYKERYQPGMPLDGQQLMDDISTLRRRSRPLMQDEKNLDNQDLGMAHRQVADALEDELVRHFDPNSQLASDFTQARTKLAQINDVETALKAGSVDPQVMARLRAKGAPLTGNLDVIADAGEHIPESAPHPLNIPRPAAREPMSLSQIPHALVQKGIKALAPNPVKVAGSQAAVGEETTAPAPEPVIKAPPGNAGPSQMTQQHEMTVPEPAARPAFDLAPPAGAAFEPAQREMSAEPGMGRQLHLQLGDRAAALKESAERGHARPGPTPEPLSPNTVPAKKPEGVLPKRLGDYAKFLYNQGPQE